MMMKLNQFVVLFSVVVALHLPRNARALNFNTLDTPFLDGLNRFICGENSESPLCSFLPQAPAATTEGEETEERMTLREFMTKVGCDTSLLPASWCSFDLPQVEGEAIAGRDEDGTEAEVETTTLVDGVILNLLCG